MFIDEVVTDAFYEQLPSAKVSTYSFGHIYKTHAYYSHENVEFWRPVIDPSEPTQTIARTFRIEGRGGNAFRHNHPLSAPKLLSNEEFIVVKAKIRPVVLLIPQHPIDGVITTGFPGKIWRKRCLVGQVFGVQDVNSGRVEFSADFISRVRKMEFPQLMFLPKHTGLFDVDSLLRFDECQSVFTPHLDPTGFAFTSEMMGIIRDQLLYLLTGKYDEDSDYALYRETIKGDVSAP